MARWVKVAAAQLGPINDGTGRDEVVERMRAAAAGEASLRTEPRS
jgi:hypothetical protein